VPGSHKTKLAHAETGDPRNLLSHGQEIAADVDEKSAVDVVLRAGEMSLHHVDIVHGSNPNRASWWRTGFIVRYSTPRMLRAASAVVIARGKRAEHLETMEARPAPPRTEGSAAAPPSRGARSEEQTSELQSLRQLAC